VIAAVVLVLALTLAGTLIATGVAEEKASRISEVLLASLRPSQLLLGKVVGIGLVALLQLLLIVVPALIASQVAGSVDLPSATAEVAAISVLWFLLGFALYSCAFAVAGALVPRQEEIQSVTAPLTIIILASFFLSFGALDDPGSSLAKVLSLLPPSAPMVMPVRMIAGDVAAWEVVVSVTLTLAAATGLIAIAARVYGAAVLRTGSRVTLRAVWRATAERA
jgi:ABC-2 type transport system permease protein